MNVKLTNGQEIEIRPITLFMGENSELLIEIANKIKMSWYTCGFYSNVKVFPEINSDTNILYHPSKMVKICEQHFNFHEMKRLEGKNIKSIIVTHSILYMSRIRRLILEGKIKSSDVAIYNFIEDEDTGKDKIVFCELDEHGIWKNDDEFVNDNSLLDELIAFSSLMTDKGLRGKRK